VRVQPRAAVQAQVPVLRPKAAPPLQVAVSAVAVEAAVSVVVPPQHRLNRLHGGQTAALC
jgi:hypothetical protein